MSDRAKPLVFGIGLPHSGGRVLATLFDNSGYAWRHHAGGKLAVNAAYAQAVGTLPFGPWPEAAGFSGLYSADKRHLPAVRVQALVRFLRDACPDAYFIHTHRDPTDWIAARYLAEDGAHRIAAVYHDGVAEADILDHWLAEQEDHARDCASLFATDHRYIDFNVTTEPIKKLINFLKPDFDLDPNAALPELALQHSDLAQVVDHIQALQKAATPPDTDMSFVGEVVDFALENPTNYGNPKALNGNAVHWRAAGRFSNPQGAGIPLTQTSDGTVLIDAGTGLERAQGTLVEMIAHGARAPLFIDMMDARFMGTDGRRTAPPRTITYNRRADAKNMTLWPLPAYHSLAPTGTLGGLPNDFIAFENKQDRCVWLGNMTGRMSPVLTPEGRDMRSVYALRTQMMALSNDAAVWEDALADLDCVPRYNAVKTLRNDPDFEIAFVLRDKWKRLSKTPAFAGLTSPKRPRDWFYQFRYVLSLAGNDTGSNFLSAAASNSLILKEEDGWELFYTDAFKPWVHYVPLADGAQDIREKLAWARAHPQDCANMAHASRAMFDKFANPNNRHAILQGIADRLNAPG